MKLRIASDLHVECHKDEGDALLKEVFAGEYDAIILAGDISDSTLLESTISRIKKLTDKDIVYVPGNHEYFHSGFEEVEEILTYWEHNIPNFWYLKTGEPLELGGYKVIGTTLWFHFSETPTNLMPDFKYIRNLSQWVYLENDRACQYLVDEVDDKSIVVTHHLPSYKSIAPKYKNSPLIPFFVCNVEGIIKRFNPPLWIHGHTHHSVDYKIGYTRVVCNPLGYPKESNPQFSPTFDVTV